MRLALEVKTVTTEVVDQELPLPYYGRKDSSSPELLRVEAIYWPHLPEKLKGLRVQQVVRQAGKKISLVTSHYEPTPQQLAQVAALMEKHSIPLNKEAYTGKLIQTLTQLDTFTL